jgi:hypothetical protein
MNGEASEPACFEAFDSFIILTRIFAWRYVPGHEPPGKHAMKMQKGKYITF